MAVDIDLKHKLAKFADCELDCTSGRLYVHGKEVNIEPLIFQFLLLLIKYNGEVVSKQTVLSTLWPNKTPSDEALRAMVKKTREVLNDNARNPSYVKTIPTKGYLLIPNVVLSSTIIQTSFQKYRNKIFIFGLLVTVGLILLMFYLLSNIDSKENDDETAIVKSELSVFNTNKVNAHYLYNDLLNISVMPDESKGSTTLLFENVSTRLRKSFVIKSVLGDKFWWSSRLNTLLVMRNDASVFYALEFDKNHNFFLTNYSYTALNEYEILGIYNHDLEVYALHKPSQRIDIINLRTQDIRTYTELQNSLVEAANSSFTVQGFWPKPQNKDAFVAVSNANDFYIYELVEEGETGSGIAVQASQISKLAGNLQAGVWNVSGTRFTFSDNQSKMYSYQVDSKTLSSWVTQAEDVKGLIADCGEACFIVSNTRGVSKLHLIDEPFNTENNHVFSSISNGFPLSESLPIIQNNRLIFSRQSGDSNVIIMAELKQNQYTESELIRFDGASQIDELVSNFDENILVGLVNQRPFSLNIETKELDYITLTLPKISQLLLNESGNLEFYAEPINKTKGVYEFNFQNKQLSLVKANAKYVRNLVLRTSTNEGNASYRAKFIIDLNNKARVEFENRNPTISISLQHNSCISCLFILDNYVYQVDASNNKDVLRTNLLNGESQVYAMPIGDLSGELSMDKERKKLALINQQQLKTKLIKLEGLSQVY